MQSPKPQVTTTTNSPPAYLEPKLTDVANKSQAAYEEFKSKGYNMPYAGDRTAGTNEYDTIANNALLATAGEASGQGTNINNLGDSVYNKVNSGYYGAPTEKYNLAPTNNLTDNINAQLAPVYRNFSEKLLPQLKSSAIENGAYGGTKYMQTGEQLGRDTQEQAGNIAAMATYKDFYDRANLEQTDLAQRRQLDSANKQTELAASNMVPSLYSAGNSNNTNVANIYGSLADTTRNFEQSDIDAQIAYYNELVNSPFAGLGTYEGLLQGSALPGNGVQTSVMTPGRAGGLNPWASAGLQGAMALGTGGMSAGTMGNALGLGAYPMSSFNAGAAMNGLPWSDARLKNNIRLVGKLNNLNLYTWNYIWDASRSYLGVIAQEVMHIPNAVVKQGEYLAVNYSVLGFTMKEI